MIDSKQNITTKINIMNMQLDKLHFGLVIGSLLVYALAIIPLYSYVGETTFLVSLVPLVLTAGLLGTWPALMVAVLLSVFNYYLSVQGSEGSEYVWAKSLLSGVLHILIGIGVGRWRDLNGRLKLELEERKEVESKLEYLAYHDALTRLPNRIMFNDRLDVELARSGRENQKVGVLFLNVNRFKSINDSLGHELGDRLLMEVGQRLKRCLRTNDTVARFGSDTFVQILVNIRNPEDISSIALKMFESLNKPFQLADQEININARIGAAIYPADGEDRDTLLRNADAALSRAKEQGFQRLELFNSQINLKAVERMNVEGAIRKALPQDELYLHYQPIIDVATGVMSGVEALLRWQHPTLGFIPPDVFIPIAEDTGLIHPIGEFVLRTACKQAKIWHGLGFPEFYMSVNVSPRQLRNEFLADQFFKVLKEIGMEPHTLMLEITESSLLGEEPAVMDNLTKFKEAGIGLAVDDFGTGYSCLANLKKLPITCLKVDKAFIKEINSDSEYATIVYAIIAIAKALKLKVIAEGVETQEQCSFLWSMQCDAIQGYLFNKPIPPKNITDILMDSLNRRKLFQSQLQMTEDI